MPTSAITIPSPYATPPDPPEALEMPGEGEGSPAPAPDPVTILPAGGASNPTIRVAAPEDKDDVSMFPADHPSSSFEYVAEAGDAQFRWNHTLEQWTQVPVINEF